ncbi:MAG: HAMP domain-containing histidine kinase [Bacilli bacterium]|nr:HAMP domain-containing histidine kinase [Bacilli bacterium]
MISLKTFFKQKMAQFLMILLAVILVVSNIVIFVMANIQYDREVQRQQDAFSEMMVHLITMESMDTAITYIEHYNHTQGIDIAFFDDNNNLLYQTASNVNTENEIILRATDNTLLGYVYFDDQESILGSDLSLGLLLLNGFSILVFLVFLKFTYSYLNNWYGLLQEDFGQTGKTREGFHFEDIQEVSQRLIESLETETRLKEYQKEYVKMLAHDIKTPLTVIKAYLEGLKLNRIDLDDETISEMLLEVDEIEHMIPKFMTENIEARPAKQNIGKIIQTIIQRLNEVFKTRNIQVDSKIDDYVLEISYLDISRLVEHLLFNAFYYNKENGTIHVILDAKTDTLTIQDNGIGMDKDTLDKVLQGNYRSEQAEELNRKGSGLGIQIIQDICQRLGYVLQISSEPNIGTSIQVRFR